VSYNASVATIYNAMVRLVRYENKTILFQFVKNALVYYNAGVAVVKSAANPTTLSYNASVVKIYSATNSRARF
jgi:hypothetical protein